MRGIINMKGQKQKFYISACSISIIVLWGFLWLQYNYDSKQARTAAETTASNLSKAFEENILGTIRHLDEFLITLRRDYPQHQDQIAELIDSYNRHSEQKLIIQLSIVDPAGIMIYNTLGMPDKPLDLSDREHFRVHLNSSEDKLFISKPIMGRVSKKWSVQFTRKLLNQDGAFAGVVVLSVDPEYFTNFYRSIDIGTKSAITLLGSEGIILARSSNSAKDKDAVGTVIPRNSILIDPAKPPTGVYYAASVVDGVTRIVSYRRLKNYPLTVRVALDEDEAFKVHHWHRLSIVLQGLIASGGLLLILWLALRLDTRQQLYTRGLETINSSLQERIDATIAELRQMDQLMITQGRQAAMGEMIGNIAHQWRQPLNALAMVLGNFKSAYQYNELTDDYVDKLVESGNRLIQKMSTTINDFRNFFRPDKEIVSFPVLEQIHQAIALVDAGLASQNITIHLDAPHEIMASGFPNEYSQVLLNLLTNARDAIKESGVLVGSIKIRLYERDGEVCTSVSDNGGGIPDDIIDRIFEPYFSTKQMGTGIGLYMSKMIIERSMGGTVEVHNIDSGAEFIVVTPLGGAA